MRYGKWAHFPVSPKSHLNEAIAEENILLAGNLNGEASIDDNEIKTHVSTTVIFSNYS